MQNNQAIIFQLFSLDDKDEEFFLYILLIIGKVAKEFAFAIQGNNVIEAQEETSLFHFYESWKSKRFCQVGFFLYLYSATCQGEITCSVFRKDVTRKSSYELLQVLYYQFITIKIMSVVNEKLIDTILSITVMPLLSATLYTGLFLSPIIATPLSRWIFGGLDVAGSYKIGIMLCIVFLIQVYTARHYQSLPPKENE